MIALIIAASVVTFVAVYLVGAWKLAPRFLDELVERRTRNFGGSVTVADFANERKHAAADAIRMGFEWPLILTIRAIWATRDAASASMRHSVVARSRPPRDVHHDVYCEMDDECTTCGRKDEIESLPDPYRAPDHEWREYRRPLKDEEDRWKR